ncbi:bifunctional oligoribonuclease/PAP phosphatase NrnA [Aureisphaera galaxeae]|uniref:DHH family phosphoesterase n=1 Tax=Aureisphaera galaxeae TaxID=1538023 RepID=UPI002350B2E9|nr:bifunctional oligoribonuclease/PAP phosphatase NrnA [Aureisphaera galaxeae]MDC8003473.1 bifunctional oligoribonuclease/PAP phosphatase NrnA [Aureisphaera galaxeae]
MNKDTLETVNTLLANPKNIVVIGHKNPDGDAVGSCLGLSFFLKQRGHTTQVIMPNDFPEFLKWIPGCSDILNFDKHTDQVTKAIEAADIVFTLDFNALNRTGNLTETLENVKAPFVMIDHHLSPDDYAVATYSDTSMSSTAQMVFHFIEALKGVDEISPEIATQLYVGIMTDTGSFRFPATTATTHRVIASLIEKGAKNSSIHQNIYDTNSQDRMKLLGTALNNLHVLPEYRTAYISLSQQELDDNNFKKGDTEGFVNYALSLKDIVFAIIFIENKQEGITKISFRSTGSFSVNEFARAHFNGGGHTNAAGGRSEKPLQKAIQHFISILPAYKNALNHDA